MSFPSVRSFVRSLPFREQVITASLSGFDDLLEIAMQKEPLTEELRHQALRLAQDGGHEEIIRLLTLH